MAELSSVSFPRKPQAEAHSWASPPAVSGPGGAGLPVHRSLPSYNPQGVPKAWEDGALVQKDLALWPSHIRGHYRWNHLEPRSRAEVPRPTVAMAFGDLLGGCHQLLSLLLCSYQDRCPCSS